MRVIYGLESLRRSRPLCLAMGVFDGVHLGHRAIICAAVRRAAPTGSTPAVLTFAPHPDAVLFPGGAPALLTTTEEKLALFRQSGIRLAVLARFDRSLADTPAEAFVREVLAGQLRARCLVVGEGWRFGKGGKGTPALLRRMAPDLGFSVDVVPPVLTGGRKVSSTRIRGLLVRGRVATAEGLLGRRYQMVGEVVAGEALGRALGHPTANLHPPAQKVLPADGIYACLAGQRRLRPAVTYIGRRPTIVRAGERRVEVHFLDLGSGSLDPRRETLVGRVLRVEFVARLRGDRRFPSREALVAQMARDCARARRLLKAAPRTP